jgi:hypothetical protein
MTMQDRLGKCRTELEKVSGTFCLAKWLQVTLHLQSGTNHSCHHPKVHEIPLEELAADPAALHNTAYKKEQRKLMLAGERPPECQYCWAIEDLGPAHFSDRVMKSAQPWAWSNLQRVFEAGAGGNILPSYLEVSFSNVCNFKCSYCSANCSSRWHEELRTHGSYATHSGDLRAELFDEEGNPYIEAFWRWWPDLIGNLQTFRITGGEPLLSQNTFRILEELANEPHPNLRVGVNTNLGIHPGLVEKFQGCLDRLLRPGQLKDFTVFTSIDCWGARAEYIRHGLKLSLFRANLERLLGANPGIRGVVMCTFNALSLSSFRELLEEILALRRRFQISPWHCPLLIDISMLHHPEYQSAQVLPASFLEYAESALSFMEANAHDARGRIWGFFEHERIKMKRTIEWMRRPLPAEELKRRRADFFLFFSEHDRRRDTDLVACFPEYKGFWEECRAAFHERNSGARDQTRPINI